MSETKKTIKERAEELYPANQPARIKAYIAGAESMSDRWVSVHTPPDHQNWVRILVDSKHHILPHWFNNGKWYCYGMQGFAENVTHWQEFEDFPNPPINKS